jgi:FkbM family methyltransferase
MSVLLGLVQYYKYFGLKGVLLAAKSRAFHRDIRVAAMTATLRQPLFLRLRSSDITLLQTIFLDGEYDWPFARPPRVIIDAGANIGFASVFFANKYPQSKIIALEPEASNYELLQRNTAAYPNIKTIKAALWSKLGQVHVIDPGLGHWSFQTHADARGGATANAVGMAPALTIDSLLRDFGLNYVDLLKVDIEGSEKEVFESSGNWIDRIGTIMVEIHDRVNSGCGQAVYLATKDFKVAKWRGDLTVLVRMGLDKEIPVTTDSSDEKEPACGRPTLALPLDIAEAPKRSFEVRSS